MFNIYLAVGIFVGLFIIMLISVLAGRRFALWQLKHDNSQKVQVVNVAEGAVYALLGLLIAFTFSSAYERFEARKIHIIDEVNAIDTAYLRIDLLTPTMQNILRDSFRHYVDARIAIYKKLPDFTAAAKELRLADKLRLQIWHQALEACKISNDEATTVLVIPAINNMFEIAQTRFAIRNIHPPFAVFELLIGLAILSCFLSGYSTVGKRAYNFIYIVSYVAITAFTIYVIIDLELPRIGLIRVDTFDAMMVDVRIKMNEELSPPQNLSQPKSKSITAS